MKVRGPTGPTEQGPQSGDQRQIRQAEHAELPQRESARGGVLLRGNLRGTIAHAGRRLHVQQEALSVCNQFKHFKWKT